jgi:hypothetical protein
MAGTLDATVEVVPGLLLATVGPAGGLWRWPAVSGDGLGAVGGGQAGSA